ncbi:MAG: nucleotidyltransferase domain-containing protein [Candidatus Woesearchaeota archaeon]
MVNVSKLKLTWLQTQILRKLFIKTGSSINQRQLAIELNVSQPAIKKALPYLEQVNFIKVEKDQRLSIKLNTENNKITQLKRVDNLKHLYESNLADYLEKEFAGATIIVFGSFSRGEDTINSDIDIAVIGRKEKQLKLENYKKLFEREINIQYYESFQKINKHLKENLANGIILFGGFEL